MEDTHFDIPPLIRASDKRFLRQVSYNFAFLSLLVIFSLGFYFFAIKNSPPQVLGTETAASPFPYPTFPPIPTLIPTTPTPTPPIHK